MSDGTCPWATTSRAGRHASFSTLRTMAARFPGTSPTATVGSKKYLCYDFEGCKAGYPVKVCTFDGNHTPSVVDDGTNGGDDGLKALFHRGLEVHRAVLISRLRLEARSAP